MRTAVTVILFVAVAALGLTVHRQSLAIREQRLQIQKLNARLGPESRHTGLELQEKCAKQAEDAVKLWGYQRDGVVFTNHYNERLAKCFVEIENTDAGTPPLIWTHKTLVDAFEGRVYAHYAWHTDKVKKYWEVPPVDCKVTLPSSEKKTCSCSDEFDMLVEKNYMD